ncbi:uncharacterized protein MPTK1_4g07590 [Marchantia polymorpha subsp. ruderalis]|uniref:Sulfite exporter TauE/SafE family protein n=2 Tax=Marchantia polymorpha TaxID=3197 RepID=A0AAF6B7H1_MARPO|nr:hypothetical protein MARPO_0115s0022 [Marchantia polymorpha]BBN07955.1 hypothetical protein Mp_4g07590 [Marchantia polymorpha subsp. ruderalis]|eukprot:PTQ31099.1 hypothetical protein MARPO_0115s0022 [Marchantia polymorpha]
MESRINVQILVVIISTIFVFCHSSPAEDDVATSAFLKSSSSRVSFWKENEQWLKSFVGAIDDDEDLGDKWPKLELSWRLFMGTLVGFAGSALGSAAGVGGGGFYLTMLNLFIGFDAKTSTALSKAMVMGAAVASTLFNLRERHPTEKNKPVIDYSMAVLFQPLLLVGISIGVIFNVMLPEWLITVFLCVLFFQISSGAISRANELSRREKMLRKTEQCATAEGECGSGEYVAISSGDESPAEAEENVPTPFKLMIVWSKTAMLLVTWAIFLLLQITKLYAPDCSAWYWILNAVQIPVALGVTCYEAWNQKRNQRHQLHSELGVPDERKAPSGLWKYLLYATYGLGGGIIGGLLGVGGGAIMGPAYLELGLPPQVASSTASFVMVFSSSLSVMEYWLLDRLPGAYGVYCVSLAVVASLCGQVIIKRVVQATGRASLIVYTLAFSVLASGIVLTILGAIRIYITWTSGGYMGFNSVCAAP